MRRTGLEANSVSNKASGKPRTRRVADQYGFELDGPVFLPKVYNGRNRTFFMFAFEKYREAMPFPALGTVATAEQRAGDFSKTFTASGKLYTIYDPLTIEPNPAFDPKKPVSLSNLQYVRQPFAGNQVPKDRMEPLALRVLEDIPLPNQAGDPLTGANNWYAGNVAQQDDYQSFIARVDHTFTDRWKAYGRWNHSFRDGGRIDYWGWGTPATQQIHGARRNDGAVLDLVGTLTPATILSARLGFNRFEQYSVFIPQDVSGLGFPQKLVSQLQIPNKYPQFRFDGYLQTGIDEWDITPNETYTAQASLMKVFSRHTLKAGAEYRLMHNATVYRANGAGTYSFDRSWTNSNPQVLDPTAGNSIASFLLGDMASASTALNAAPYLSWRYPVLFFQDDWQVNRRLTVNYGLRWDDETAPVERYNRQNRGFDPTAPLPVQVAGLELKGGLLFAGTGKQPRAAFDPGRDNLQPRVGLAYKVFKSKPLVFRAGAGRYFLPGFVTNYDFGGTLGFSQTTVAQVSTPDYLPLNTLSNPFPNGLVLPAGASLGVMTNAGGAIAYSDPARWIPNIWQFSAGFQYEITPGLLVETSYAGSRTGSLGVSRQLDYLTVDQLSLGTQYLSAKVPNLFYNVFPANTPLGSQAMVQRRSLLLPYPQFTSVTMNNYSVGESWYNSFQLKVQRRFKIGLSVLASYTASKTMEAVAYKNAQDAAPSRELSPYDVPQRLVVSGFYELPFGSKHKWFSSGLLSHAIGGWQLSWSGTVQSGTPMALPDYDLTGDPKLAGGQTLNHWFNTSVWKPRSPDTLRITSLYSPNIRRQTAPQVDLSVIRDFPIHEAHRVQFRATAHNATNTPIFGFPDTTPGSPRFGMVPSTQFNSPRSVELGVRYAF